MFHLTLRGAASAQLLCPLSFVVACHPPTRTTSHPDQTEFELGLDWTGLDWTRDTLSFVLFFCRLTCHGSAFFSFG